MKNKPTGSYPLHPEDIKVIPLRPENFVKSGIADVLKPVLDRLSAIEVDNAKLKNDVKVLEFHRNCLYRDVTRLQAESRERDRKSWEAGSRGGVDG